MIKVLPTTKKAFNLRNLLVQFHRWLGLIIGLFCFSLCFTGTLLVFDTELTDLFDRKLRIETSPHSLEGLHSSLRTQLPEDSKLTRIELHTNRVGVKTSEGYKKFYYDPNSFEITGTGNGVMRTVLKLHRNLLIGKNGRIVIFASTLGLIFLAITGLRLWWPRNRKALINSLKVKTSASKRRLWLDVHRVGGFYILLPLILIALTGFGFSIFGREFRDAIQWMCRDQVPAEQILMPHVGPLTLDGSLQLATQTLPGYQPTVVQLSSDKPETTVRFKSPKQPGQYGRSFVKLDLRTGQILKVVRADKLAAGTKFNQVWLLPLHRGRAFGTAHQLLWLLVGIVGSLLPLTGLWLWWKRGPRKRG